MVESKPWEELTEEERTKAIEIIFKILYECNPDWFNQPEGGI